MFTCPYCEFPFALKRDLTTHIEIKHPTGLSDLLGAIRDEAKNYIGNDLDDDGIYNEDVVVHAPYDDED